MTGTINKIKYDRKTGLVHIEYELTNKETDDMKVVLKSYDKPLPSLVENLDALATHVEDICELPEGYCSRSEIRGVSFSHTNDILGAVITCLVKVDSANSPVVINTPHLPSDQYSEDGQSPLLNPKCVSILRNLIFETERYIDGFRDKEDTKQTEIQFEG